MTFSTSLFLLIEKVLLARISVQEMEAAVTVAFICQIFQITYVALAMMAQVNVAQWAGEKNWKKIGPGIWQFIWFSILSIFLTMPIGIAYGNFFLEKAALKGIGFPYFCILLSINFLYPLATALSCFYLGRGKTRFVLWGAIGSQILKIGLAFLLILGLGSWIPKLGLIGAALSTLIAQVVFCIYLFVVFIQKKNQDEFQTGFWRFQPKFFWHCIKPGLLRAINRVLNVTSWTSVVQLMVAKGQNYLIVFSVGGALSLFIPFISEALCQAETIVVSHLIGARRFHSLHRAMYNGLTCAVVCSAFLLIPFVFFSSTTFHYLFPNIDLDSTTVFRIFLGVWVSFLSYTVGFIPISFVLAFKDMVFSALMGAFNWVNGFLLMYIALQLIQIPADQFWLVHSLMHASTAIIYYLRAKFLCSRALESLQVPELVH